MTIEDLTALIEAVNKSHAEFRRVMFAELDAIKVAVAALTPNGQTDPEHLAMLARLDNLERQLTALAGIDRYASNRMALRKTVREILNEGK